jgi:hypothetical protein
VDSASKAATVMVKVPEIGETVFFEAAPYWFPD